MKIFLRWCFQNITSRYPGLLLFSSILLSAVSIFIASGLTYNSRMDNLLPQELELVKEFNEVVDKTGGSGPLVIVLEGIKQSRANQVIGPLARRLEKLEGVRFVDYQLPKAFLNNRQLLLATRQDLIQLEALIVEAIDFARNELGGLFPTEEKPFNPEKLQTFAKDYHVFEDINLYHKGKIQNNFYIFVQPRGTITDTDFTESFVESIQQAVKDSKLEEKYEGLKIKLTGSMLVRLEENNRVITDLKRAAIIAAILTTSIIFIYTRSFFSIPLIIFPLLISLSYTFALTRIFIGHVNIISGFLVAILMGLGIDYGIHLYIRFKQELLKGKAIPKAVELVMTQVGRSSIIAMFTTISVFSLLIFSDFEGFSEFGLIAVFGIACAFLTYFFIFPAQVLFYDKIHWLRKPKPRLFTLKISDIFINTPYRLGALIALTIFASLFLLPKIQFEYDFRNLRGDSPAADYETETSEDFGYVFSPTVILTPNKENLFFIHQTLAEIKSKYAEKSTIGIQRSLNLFSRKEFDSKIEIIDRIRKMFENEKDIIKLALGEARFRKLKTLVNVVPFDEKKIPKNLINNFTIKGEYILFILSPAEKNFFDVRNIYQLEKEINELKTALKEKQITAAVLNENLLAARVMDWVVEKGPQAMAFALALVFIILVLDMQSFSLALKTFIPLFTGLVITGAVMSIFEIKLNFINIVMLPSIVGIMIDHCIYLAHHILDYSKGETIKSVKETGSSIILSALTSLGGYASLNIAAHKGIRSIANVVELGILICTVCALFMLPALFQLGQKKPVLQAKGPEDIIPDEEE